MSINAQWLSEFTSSFEHFVEGEDGEIIGRQIWRGYSEAQRAARAANPTMGYEDALAEANAWAATSDQED